MPARQLLIVHERRGHWARHLRPRVAGRDVRLVETRSGAELARAVAGSACPIVVVDLADRPRAGLDDLDAALGAAPNGLALVIDPSGHPEVALLAREIGAAQVLSGPVTPPAVIDLVAHWLPLARRRGDADGWSAPPGSARDPFDGPDPIDPARLILDASET